MRPRGWHLVERHFEVDGQPISASLFDFGLYLLRNHEALRAIGSGPYFYLPKLESHLEARLWNRVFERAQDELGIAARHDPRDGADRDDPRRVRDGRDPLRARAARDRPERGPLGLPVQRDQEARPPPRVRAARPQRRRHGRAVHARLRRAAGARPATAAARTRSAAWRRSSRRAATRRSTRSRSRRSARTRSARPRRATTAPGSPTPISCRSRSRSSTACSASGPTSSTSCARTSCPTPAALLDVAATPGRGHRGRPAQRHLGRDPVHRGVARRQRRGRDLQPDGGRRDQRDLARPGLAVAPPRPLQPRRTSRAITDEEMAKLGAGYEQARELFDAGRHRRGVRRVPDAARLRAAELSTARRRPQLRRGRGLGAAGCSAADNRGADILSPMERHGRSRSQRMCR